MSKVLEVKAKIELDQEKAEDLIGELLDVLYWNGQYAKQVPSNILPVVKDLPEHESKKCKWVFNKIIATKQLPKHIQKVESHIDKWNRVAKWLVVEMGNRSILFYGMPVLKSQKITPMRMSNGKPVMFDLSAVLGGEKITNVYWGGEVDESEVDIDDHLQVLVDVLKSNPNLDDRIAPYAFK